MSELTAAQVAAAYDLRGRTAMVAGGGAAAATAHALAAAGTTVIAHAGATDPADMAALIEHCRAELGRVDIVVHAARAPGRDQLGSLAAALWLADRVPPLLSTNASIVHIGESSETGDCASAAAVAGLAGLTRWQAKRLGPRGVRVNLVLAGVAAGGAEHAAAAALFLASDEAAGVNGETVVVAGGP